MSVTLKHEQNSTHSTAKTPAWHCPCSQLHTVQ